MAQGLDVHEWDKIEPPPTAIAPSPLGWRINFSFQVGAVHFAVQKVAASQPFGLSAQKHKYAKMRTTIEIPDELYRSLKARAALSGLPVRAVVTQLIDLGLRSGPAGAPASGRHRQPPPVAIAPHGAPVPAMTREDMRRAEEGEDEAKLARSA